jgi:hypothetical protein
MVSVTLIFEAFEHVAKSLVLIMECLLGNYIFFLISPWWLTWYPSKLVTLEKRVATGGLLEGSSYHSHSYLPLSTLLPLCFLIFWVFGFIDPKKGLYLISWEEGAKGPEVLQLAL